MLGIVWGLSSVKVDVEWGSGSDNGKDVKSV